MQVKNRAWVKNAIIIFLAIMLVLTFFSNTIMNYSLPEVAGQRAQYGPIKTSIRGQGTVTANESFTVELEETRQIAKIHFKAGDTIEAGAVLFSLEASDSEELKTAQKTLRDMELALNKKLLEMKAADYDDENREIAIMQEDLQELVDKKDNIAVYAQALESAKAAVKAASDRVKALEKEQAAIEADIADLGSEDEFDYRDLLTDALKKLQTAVGEAQVAEETAQKAVDKAQADLDNNSGSSGGGSASSIQAAISAKKDDIADLKVSQESQKWTALAAIEASAYTVLASYIEYIDPDTGGTQAALLKLFKEVQAQTGGTKNEMDARSAVSAYYTYDATISQAETDLFNLQVDYDNATSSSNNNTYYQNRLNEAKAKLTKAKEATADAQKAFDRALKELTSGYKDKLSDKKDQVAAAKEALTEAEAAQTEAEEAAGVKPEELASQIKAKQREIETKLSALAQQKDDDRITQAVANLDLQAEREAIEEQEKAVDRLREKATGTEVTARYGGLLTAINCVVGDKVAAGTALASIDIAGKGFTTTMAVTNEQAQKIRVGTTATISDWWQTTYLTVTAIRVDPDSQGRRRIVEFAVEGENVTAGQQLNITLSPDGQDPYYECVVPNSAVREDADGTFILAAQSKSTPLGTRYTAVRIDITVLAKDDTNTAFSRDNYDGEFVITTATKPVEPGSQVRLID